MTELPDKGTGEDIVFADLNWQSYVTEMNRSMATKGATCAIVQFVIPHMTSTIPIFRSSYRATMIRCTT
jgi:hypothetical protein